MGYSNKVMTLQFSAPQEGGENGVVVEPLTACMANVHTSIPNTGPAKQGTGLKDEQETVVVYSPLVLSLLQF